jgi:hypothetical protein
MSDISREYDDERLFQVFYATTGRLPQEVIEWSRSAEGKAAIMRKDREDTMVFLIAPDPDEKDPLLKAHNTEAERMGAEFGNYGAHTGEGVILSKTTLGRLTSIEKNGEVRHYWEEY